MVSETIQIVLCDQLQEEIRRVTQRPKLQTTCKCYIAKSSFNLLLKSGDAIKGL